MNLLIFWCTGAELRSPGFEVERDSGSRLLYQGVLEGNSNRIVCFF